MRNEQAARSQELQHQFEAAWCILGASRKPKMEIPVESIIGDRDILLRVSKAHITAKAKRI